MKNKIIFFLVVMSLFSLLFLTACNKSSNLTVTSIHDSFILGKTTTKELIKKFGKPDKIVKNNSMVLIQYNEDDSIEGGTSDKLHENTDYYKTLSLSNDSDDGKYTEYYEYNNSNSGLEYIRFYISKDKIQTYKFGEIVDKEKAKKDRYLSQIMD
ncbi:hypothetical protein MX022_08605 [Streptococcus uberis]|uniref:hypothetical protein n=1 Tax=Streptococcus uberis TaxID=1349 RepID=UPI001FF4064F|nr:hypothetical protein [Streptococcus uberis]MCK1165834.1 hypothetical protein [Streptococcus uberis]MCK1204449.1 hypothetical protein [Streptococcus uberis]MCK1232201.1 hypothetical protein [Streptococcus uberis]MCK1234049.1 hypothetical protein [Streptococcus uberis]MCK1254093.1 hypothetical protein [Streptococcus uberis]